MKITFLLTVYNKEKYLPKVFEGIKSQVGDFEREYIIINDGSTDNSLKLIKKLSKGLPNLIIINQKNQGIVKTCAIGIKEAKGEYIKFVDGDDFLYPPTTQALLGVLERNTSLSFATTRFDKDEYSLLESSSQRDIEVEYFGKEQALKYQLCQTDNVPILLGSTHSMVRTKAIKSINFDDYYNKGVRLGQDHILALESVLTGGFAIINSNGMEELTKIKDEYSLTRSSNYLNLMKDVIKVHINFINLHPELNNSSKLNLYKKDIFILYKEYFKKRRFKGISGKIKRIVKKKFFNLCTKRKIKKNKNQEELKSILKLLINKR